MQPERFDVVVASNLFAISFPILARPAPAPLALPHPQPESGTHFPVALRASPRFRADIYGKNIANPIATIWAGAMSSIFSAMAMSVSSKRITVFWRD